MKEYTESLLNIQNVNDCAMCNYGADDSLLDAIRLQNVSFSRVSRVDRA